MHHNRSSYKNKNNKSKSANPSNRDILDAIKKVHSQVGSLNSKVQENTAKYSALDKRTRADASALRHQASKAKKTGCHLNQQNMESDVILKSFKFDFEIETVLKHFCTIFNVTQEAIYDKFKLPFFMIDRTTSQKQTLFLLVVRFVRKTDKISVMAQEEIFGGLSVQQLVPNCPPERKDDVIRIYHRLTKSNLAVNRKLYQLKSDGKIEQKTFKNGFFCYKDKATDEKWITVVTIAELEKKFDAAPPKYQNKRKPPSSAESNATNKTKGNISKKNRLSFEDSDSPMSDEDII